MSMIRQIGWLLTGVIVLALGGSLLVGAWTARESVQAQWQARNADAAALLALAAVMAAFNLWMSRRASSRATEILAEAKK